MPDSVDSGTKVAYYSLTRFFVDGNNQSYALTAEVPFEIGTPAQEVIDYMQREDQLLMKRGQGLYKGAKIMQGGLVPTAHEKSPNGQPAGNGDGSEYETDTYRAVALLKSKKAGLYLALYSDNDRLKWATQRIFIKDSHAKKFVAALEDICGVTIEENCEVATNFHTDALLYHGELGTTVAAAAPQVDDWNDPGEWILMLEPKLRITWKKVLKTDKKGQPVTRDNGEPDYWYYFKAAEVAE